MQHALAARLAGFDPGVGLFQVLCIDASEQLVCGGSEMMTTTRGDP